MPPEVGVAVEFVPPLAIGKVPVTPVVSGKPVKFVANPDAGVPKIGVTNVGDVDNTTFPVPVDVVTPVPPLVTGKVPDTPEARGKPVAFVNTTALGVPKAGVVKLGEDDNTTLPVPVDVVTPVPPLATATVPEILLALIFADKTPLPSILKLFPTLTPPNVEALAVVKV